MLKKALLFTASILALFSKAVFAKSINLESETVLVANGTGQGGGGGTDGFASTTVGQSGA